MNRRNNFLTYLLALFPGIGYMYLGLLVKGVETLAIFMPIEPLFSIIGLGFITGLVRIPIWFFVFFDTINTAKRMDNGEVIRDEDFIFRRLNNNSSFNTNNSYNTEGIKKNIWIILGWSLVVLGALALSNRLLRSFGLYNLIKSYMSMYMIPLLFILVGVYILFRNKSLK